MQPDDFKLLKQHHPQIEKHSLLLGKMLFPYTYFDNVDRLKETSLPPREAYFNDLTKEECSEADYETAVKIWETFELADLKSLVKLYCETDVLQTVDIFIRFRNVTMKEFELDPLHFVSLPSLCWQACMKVTDLRVELITDSDMYLMWQRAKFGGFTTVVSQYEKANNPLLDDFNPDDPISWMFYWDCTGMYSTVMQNNKLPCGNMRFLSDEEVAQLDYESYDPSGDIGYLVECIFSFVGKEVQVILADFPPCPVLRSVPADEQSPRMQRVAESMEIPLEVKTKKLIADLNPRVNYVLPLTSLQFILKTTGATLHSITRAIQFKQEAILTKYIQLCMDKRKAATNSFEISLFKLYCNAVFGVTLLDVTKYVNCHVVFTQARLKRLIDSPLYVRANEFDKNAAVVEMKYSSTTIRQPIFLGISILALSKNLILDMYYNVLKKEYGSNISLQMSDTDSIVFKVFKETENFYMSDILPKFAHLLDTSNYDRSSPLYTDVRKKQLGTFTDETGGRIISECVALKCKAYSILVKDGDPFMKAKGCPTAERDRLSHEDYKNTLFNQARVNVIFNRIGSKRQRLYTFQCSKVALSSYENKRYWIDTLYKSLPFGHYSINTASQMSPDLVEDEPST